MDKDIIVADTIGLCDTDWDDSKIINMIKSRIDSNLKHIDAVYIVFRADRLIEQYVQNIKKILTWLDYFNGSTDNDLRFQFIGTFAENIDEEQKAKLRSEAKEIFGLKDTRRAFIEVPDLRFNSLIYTGFPPERSLNSFTKQNLQKDWKKLMLITRLPGDTKRITINQNSLCTIL